MYEAIATQPSCCLAWLAAAQKIGTAGGDLYNVVVDIENPTTLRDADRRVLDFVDGYLRVHNAYPIETIANTIFPDALYRRFGAPAFYKIYLDTVLPRVKRPQGDWGRYFERMIHHRTPDGETINPLEKLVDKVRLQAHAKRKFRNVFELSVFDPVLDLSTYNPRDAGRVMNRQCLSFLSFKLHPEKGLMLTVMYRNHYYIARALGNFVGLGRLLGYVAKESDVAVGPLTCISTHAEIDHNRSWRKRDAEALLAECAAVIRETGRAD